MDERGGERGGGPKKERATPQSHRLHAAYLFPLQMPIITICRNQCVILCYSDSDAHAVSPVLLLLMVWVAGLSDATLTTPLLPLSPFFSTLQDSDATYQ